MRVERRTQSAVDKNNIVQEIKIYQIGELESEAMAIPAFLLFSRPKKYKEGFLFCIGSMFKQPMSKSLL
jgi:hypothetical protein